jgi:predicted PurR-regulated permease PerM
MLKNYKKLIFRISLIMIMLGLVLMYLYVESVNSVTNLIFISFIISYSVKPIRDFISEKFRLSYKAASLIIILSSLISFGALLYFIIPTIIKESSNIGPMIDSINGYVLKVADKFNVDNLPIFELAYGQIGEKLNTYITNLSNNLVDNLIGIMGNIIGLAIVPIVAYYFLADGDRIYNKLLLIFPTEKRVIIKRINYNIDKVLSRYIISQLILSAIIGVLTFILLILIGVKFTLVLSVINAIANIIPYFGPIIGGIPIVFIALTESITKGLLALVGAFVIQQIEGDLLAPKITGDSTDMHPIIIIILLILGEKLGGAAGMVLSVPIAVIIKVIYDDINYYLF